MKEEEEEEDYTNIGSVLNCKCYQMIYSYCSYTIIVAVEEL